MIICSHLRYTPRTNGCLFRLTTVEISHSGFFTANSTIFDRMNSLHTHARTKATSAYAHKHMTTNAHIQHITSCFAFLAAFHGLSASARAHLTPRLEPPQSQ